MQDAVQVQPNPRQFGTHVVDGLFGHRWLADSDWGSWLGRVAKGRAQPKQWDRGNHPAISEVRGFTAKISRIVVVAPELAAVTTEDARRERVADLLLKPKRWNAGLHVMKPQVTCPRRGLHKPGPMFASVLSGLIVWCKTAS
ncbi:MAG: hybrid sensor histidine kinase/response regulator [Cypionkella sp.]|nr:hybrid sensor histidine kinase/response regulator [Cypionkella sp.]